jgi:hyperosmotically inducible protein
METQWFNQSKRSLIVLAVAALLPTLSFASSSVGNAANDTVITGKVKSSLAMNDVTHAQGISVETNDGVVTLSGATESSTEASKAVEIAESTIGVKRVDASQLVIKNSSQPMTDSYITAKVKGIFLKNNLTPGELSVPLVDVYLSGQVKNAVQRSKLIQLAKSIDGVTDVKTTIEIRH